MLSQAAVAGLGAAFVVLLGGSILQYLVHLVF
jgi:hypothetical protein